METPTKISGTPSTSNIKQTTPDSPCGKATLQLKGLMNNINGFCEQLDTQLRATLYSLTMNDKEDAQNTMKDFQKSAETTVRDVCLKHNAFDRRMASMTRSVNQISAEKRGLSDELKTLKTQGSVQEEKCEASQTPNVNQTGTQNQAQSDELQFLKTQGSVQQEKDEFEDIEDNL